MTPSELKHHVAATGSCHFDRANMRFSGDTMRNYGVRKATITSDRDPSGAYRPDGVQREVWELYRKHPVKHGLRRSAYFDCVTFKKVFPRVEDR